MKRPPIIDDKKRPSKFVKGVIYDLDGNLVGLVMREKEKTFIEFFGKTSVIVIIDKKEKSIRVEGEDFPKDPREVLERIFKSLPTRDKEKLSS